MPRMKVLPFIYGNTHGLLSIATVTNLKSTFNTKRALLRSFAKMSSTDDAPTGSGTMRHEAQVKAMRQQLHEDSNELISSSPIVQKNGWDSLWQENITPWDLGKPTPVLLAELDVHWDKATLSNEEDHTSTTTSTFRSLVPGCGAGYDLVTLALHHETWMAQHNDNNNNNKSSKPSLPNSAVVVGLDISATSLVERASTVVAAGIESDNNNSTNPTLQNTRVDLINGDFFKPSEWNVVRSFGSDDIEQHPQTLGQNNSLQFDFIFDYTFFCALHPSMRSKWGAQMAKLLTPGTGRLLTMIFPIMFPPPTAHRWPDGPPFPVTVEDYRAVLEPHGIVMDVRTSGHDDITGITTSSSPVRVHPDTVAPRVGKEMVCWWVRTQPLDSHL